jgi:peroxiredoxin
MRLHVPDPAPVLKISDIYGQPITLGGGQRRTLLCFFRDAACPFCNFRIYELTSHHRELDRLGLDIVAVFSSTREQVKRFVARHPRPFRVVADPSSRAHEAYRIESSLRGKLKAILTRIPTLLRGLRIVGLAGLRTNNLLPADFLIDEQGRIVEAYYGRDAGDHIPIERVEWFVARGLLERERSTSVETFGRQLQARGGVR